LRVTYFSWESQRDVQKADHRWAKSTRRQTVGTYSQSVFNEGIFTLTARTMPYTTQMPSRLKFTHANLSLIVHYLQVFSFWSFFCGDTTDLTHLCVIHIFVTQGSSRATVAKVWTQFSPERKTLRCENLISVRRSKIWSQKIFIIVSQRRIPHNQGLKVIWKDC